MDLLASNNLGKPKNKVNCTPTLDCNLSNSHKTCKKRQRETLALVCTRLAVEPGTEKGGGREMKKEEELECWWILHKSEITG